MTNRKTKIKKGGVIKRRKAEKQKVLENKHGNLKNTRRSGNKKRRKMQKYEDNNKNIATRKKSNGKTRAMNRGT